MSKFQLKKLSLALMVLGSAGVANTASAQVNLFLSGATAQDVTLVKAVADLCQAGTGTRINTTGAGVGTTILCTGNAASGVNGQALTISKQTTGGSANGVKPVNDGKATLVGGAANSMLRPSITTGGCTNSGVDTVTGFPLFTCTTNAGPAVPHAGLSDVEPTLLALGPDTTNLQFVGTVGVQFAPAVTTELYKKLQAQQGKIVGDFSEAQAPSLHPADFRGILNGTIVDWSQVVPGITPNPVGVGITTELKLCRRATTSGTQKSFETRMFNQGDSQGGANPGCNGSLAANNGALNPILGNNDDGTALNDGVNFSTGTALNQGGYRGRTDAYTVVVNSGAGDVQTCLTTADGQGEMAIGLLSTELTAPAGWKFVRMGNIFPNRQSLVDGGWDQLWTQATFQRRIAVAGDAVAYTGGQTTVMNALQTRVGDPANILALGLQGVAALPSNGYTWTGLVANPVMRGERKSTGGIVNNCQEALTQ